MQRDDREMEEAIIVDHRFAVGFHGRKLLVHFLTEWFRNVVRAGLFHPLRFVAGAVKLLGQLARMIVTIGPWQVLRVSLYAILQKGFAVQTFQSVHSRLGLSRNREYDLRELVATACTLKPSLGIWTVEGLGFQFVQTALGRRDPPRELLCRNRLAELPARCQLPLNIGAGLAFSIYYLIPLTSRSSKAEITLAMHEVIEVSSRNVQPHYHNAIIEGLGFVAWSARQDRVMALGQTFFGIDQSMADCFWHGVGRAMYFSPDNFLPPGSLGWNSLAAACRVSPDDRARENAIAGLAWAVTLVNLRRPLIIDVFLRAHDGSDREAEALADGVGSAAVVWLDWSRQPGYVEDLCRFRPVHASTASWNRIVRGPVSRVLEKTHRKQQNLSELFRFQPFDI